MRVQDWAPSGLAESRRLRSALDAVVMAWRERWVGRGELRVTVVEDLQRDPMASEIILGPSGKGLRLTGSPRARTRLLEQCLDIRLADQVLTDDDRSVLAGLQTAMLQDLFDRVDEILSARDGSGHRLLTVRVGDDSDDLLGLSFPSSATAELWSTSSQEVGPALAPLGQALAGTEVLIEASLGESTLTVGELRGLAPGDVLVLDTALADPSPVRLARAGRALGRAALAEVDGGLVATVAN